MDNIERKKKHFIIESLKSRHILFDLMMRIFLSNRENKHVHGITYVSLVYHNLKDI
jgi:hypothetical protein